MQTNALISSLNRCLLPELAIFLFLRMKDHKVLLTNVGELTRLATANSTSRNTRIDNVSDRLRVLIRQADINVFKDVFSFGIIFSVLEKFGESKVLVDIFKQIPPQTFDSNKSSEDSREVRRNIVFYNSALSAFCKTGDWKSALKM